MPNSSVGTRSDTPLRDIPQSIQIIPQEVLRDQNVTRLDAALENVPGVVPFGGSRINTLEFTIRGFETNSGDSNNILRNGLRETGSTLTELTPNIERIEVLKGPASVLYGLAGPGGTINLVTKQPLRDPFYAIDATVGSYDFYRGAIDLSGPLNDSKTVLYRLNASYLDRGSFVIFLRAVNSRLRQSQVLQLGSALVSPYLTRTNVLMTDTRPGVPLDEFSIQTGEQRSRGVELNLAGEILPGWNILAGYAYTDARLTEDNILPVGNRLQLAPENAFSLWMTYEIQSGDFQGLALGLGLFFVGEREGDIENTFQLPSYLRTDAAVFYTRNQFRVALNFRNLFNVNYFESAFSPLRVYYGDPFTVQGTVSWQF